MSARTTGILRALGPGLLFAATAVGASQFVPSTRAGAKWGLALAAGIVLANAIKYPAFRFGPLYATVTGTSLLEGYRRQGKWALVLFLLLTLGTMFTLQATVSLTTAGLAIAALGLKTSPLLVAVALIGICTTLLAIGRYRWLDRGIKALVVALSLSTLIATALALPRLNWSHSWMIRPDRLDTATIVFAVALVGSIPAGIDVSVWHSLWTLARQHDTGHAPTSRESSVDFHIGYIATAVLALCCMLIGAGVMYGSGIELAESAAEFAPQLIDLFTTRLGQWARPIICVSAFAIMFSSMLAVQDGFPRVLAVLSARFRGPEESAGFELDQPAQRRVYWVALGLLTLGTMIVLAVLMKSLELLIGVAATISFLGSPILSALNHRAVLGSEVPAERHPRRWLVWASLAGIAFQATFALYWVYIVATT